MTQLSIRYVPVQQLAPDPANARLHSDRQIGKIARSIERFGFNNPLLVDGRGGILCGHGRYRAALKLRMADVPVVQLDHLTAAQKRAYMLADNRTAEDAEWDPDLLAAEFEQLIALDPEFEITDTGFEMAEVDQLLMPADGADEPDPADLPVHAAEVAAVARPGDLWQIGDHRIFCGDALDPASYAVLLGRERAAMVFTDPPYNRAISVVANNGRTQHAEFVQASGEMTGGDFTRFLGHAFGAMAAASIDGAIHFVCMDWRGLGALLAAGEIAYTELKNLVVWVKANGGMGTLYRSQHELIAVFKSGTAPHRNNVQLGATGRNRTNVWSYPGMNSFGRGRDAALALHPTVKPVALCADAMLDCSARGDLVLDGFGGSGTTLLAAERCGRRARLVERDPHYVDVTLHRARTLLGLDAVNLWSGERLPALPGRSRNELKRIAR